jgi:hypothetical protein
MADGYLDLTSFYTRHMWGDRVRQAGRRLRVAPSRSSRRGLVRIVTNAACIRQQMTYNFGNSPLKRAIRRLQKKKAATPQNGRLCPPLEQP